MVKKLKDITFEEFLGWANMRACDGAWSMADVIACIDVTGEVLRITPLFGRKKAREKKWQEIKGKYLNLEAEIEIEK